jgi:hypothetical protein
MPARNARARRRRPGAALERPGRGLASWDGALDGNLLGRTHAKRTIKIELRRHAPRRAGLARRGAGAGLGRNLLHGMEKGPPRQKPSRMV